MYKNILILLIPILFTASCQTKVESINLKTEGSKNTNTSSKNQTKLSPTPKLKTNKKDINQQIGIADGHTKNICFRTKNGNLVENTSVSIVTSLNESPQKILNTVIEKKLEKKCSRYASESTDQNSGENFYYSLIPKNKKADEDQDVFGIGVIEPKAPFRFQNKLASVDLNNDGKAEFFRKCTGNEGVLFTIWTGKPLKGEKIWFSFYYLDYDTERNCKKEDDK